MLPQLGVVSTVSLSGCSCANRKSRSTPGLRALRHDADLAGQRMRAAEPVDLPLVGRAHHREQHLVAGRDVGGRSAALKNGPREVPPRMNRQGMAVCIDCARHWLRTIMLYARSAGFARTPGLYQLLPARMAANCRPAAQALSPAPRRSASSSSSFVRRASASAACVPETDEAQHGHDLRIDQPVRITSSPGAARRRDAAGGEHRVAVAGADQVDDRRVRSRPPRRYRA